MAHLLRQYLQSGAAEGAGDDPGNAGALPEKPARSVAHSWPHPRRLAAHAGDGREGSDGSGTTCTAPRPHEPVAMPEGSTAQLREQARTAAPVHSGTLRRRPSLARGQMLHASSSSQNNPAIREISPDAHFVGPAGELFNQALAEAGVDRRALYVNNTDTHFKFEPRDKRRLHSRGRTRTSRPHAGTGSRPNSIAFGPVPSCVGTRWRHKVNFGSRFRLLEQRGQWVALDVQTRGFATVHSSYLLRLPNEAGRTRGYQDFVRDLKLMRDLPPGEL